MNFYVAVLIFFFFILLFLSVCKLSPHIKRCCTKRIRLDCLFVDMSDEQLIKINEKKNCDKIEWETIVNSFDRLTSTDIVCYIAINLKMVRCHFVRSDWDRLSICIIHFEIREFCNRRKIYAMKSDHFHTHWMPYTYAMFCGENHTHTQTNDLNPYMPYSPQD